MAQIIYEDTTLRDTRTPIHWHPDAAKGRRDRLVDNMLAADARRYEGETAPPRDVDWPELSAMDTAFLSPEEHKYVGQQSENEKFMRQIDDPGIITDYPEDYVLAATGVYGLGKGLTRHVLNQVARGKRLRHLESWMGPHMRRRAQRSIDHSRKAEAAASRAGRRPIDPSKLLKRDPEMNKIMGHKTRGTHAATWQRRKDYFPDRPSHPHKSNLPKIGEGGPGNQPIPKSQKEWIDFSEIDNAIQQGSRKYENLINAGKYQKPVGKAARSRISNRNIEKNRFGSGNLHLRGIDDLGDDGAHLLEGLPEWLRRSGPPSANSIIPAAVLMDSMILEE